MGSSLSQWNWSTAADAQSEPNVRGIIADGSSRVNVRRRRAPQGEVFACCSAALLPTLQRLLEKGFGSPVANLPDRGYAATTTQL